MEAEGTRFRPGVEIGTRHHLAAAAAPGTTRSSSRRAPPCRATLPVPGPRAERRARRDGVPAPGQRGGRGQAGARTRSRRPASTSSSSAAATPAPTASAPRCGRAPRSVTTLAIGKQPPAGAPRAPAVADRPDAVRGLERRTRRAASATTWRRPSSSSATRTATSRALRLATTEYLAGRARACPTPGTEREIPADLVLLAMGFTGPETDAAGRADRRRRSPRAALVARDDDFATTVPGVFVAGDAGRGQSLVVWAIAEGRAAAAAVDAYLLGQHRAARPGHREHRGAAALTSLLTAASTRLPPWPAGTFGPTSFQRKA